MLAVEFESFEFLQMVIAHCQELGLLSDWFLHCSTSMRIAPPLNYYKKRNKKSVWDYFGGYSIDGGE